MILTKYFDSVENAASGRPFAGVQITVLKDGGLAAIYADKGGTPKSNPVLTDDNGNYEFYVEDGEYSLELRYNGEVVYRVPDLPIYRAGPQGDVGERGLPGTLQVAGLQFITPFQFMTDAQRKARVPGTTDDYLYFRAAIDHIIANATNVDGPNRGGFVLHVPDGTYYLSQTLIVKGVALHIKGNGTGMNGGDANRIYVAPNTTGFIFHRPDTGGTGGQVSFTSGADGWAIDGVTIISRGGTQGQPYDGVLAFCRGSWTRSKARGFPRMGVRVLAYSNDAGPSRGNANLMLLRDFTCNDNGISGVHIEGSDVNGFTIDGHIDTSYNGRWGIDARPSISGHILGQHAELNGVPGFGYNPAGASSMVAHANAYWYVKKDQAAGASTNAPADNSPYWGKSPLAYAGVGPYRPAWTSGMTVFEGGPLNIPLDNSQVGVTGCYAEDGQAPVRAGFKTQFYGQPFFENVGIVAANVIPPTWIRNEVGAVRNDGGFVTAGNQVARLGVGLRALEMGNVQNPATWNYQFSGPDILLAYGNDEKWRHLGPSTANARGAGFSCTDSLAVGDAGEWRRITARDAVPTSGAWLRGDRIINRAAAVGQPKGWVCTASGTPGTWASEGVL